MSAYLSQRKWREKKRRERKERKQETNIGFGEEEKERGRESMELRQRPTRGLVNMVLKLTYLAFFD